MKYFILIICFFLSNNPVFSQNNKGIIKKDGKSISLKLTKQATHENINGKVNLAILTDNNELLQLNNIDENVFKCGKKLFSKTTKIVFIEKERTYVSSSPIRISIVCIKNSNKVRVHFSGEMIHKGTKVTISSYLTITETPRKNLTIK